MNFVIKNKRYSFFFTKDLLNQKKLKLWKRKKQINRKFKNMCQKNYIET